MMFGIGILCFIYAPLLLFLKAPPTKEEKKVGDDEETEAYVNNAFVLRDENENKPQEIVHANENLLTKL